MVNYIMENKQKKMMMGFAMIAFVIPFVAASITYTATYTGTVTGTADTNLLVFTDGGDLMPGSVTDNGDGTFTITGFDVPKNAKTTLILMNIENTGDSAVDIVFTVGGDDIMAVSVDSNPITLVPNTPTPVYVTVDFETYDPLNPPDVSFTLELAVSSPP